MLDSSERLKSARLLAGYETAADAARAMGIPESTYAGHENGSRGFARNASRYADRFGVDLNWLLSGRGDMNARRRVVRIVGVVEGGNQVETFDEAALATQAEYVEMPVDVALEAIEVEGDSMRPRFLPGEFILCEKAPVTPAELLDQYAIVQTPDGRRMVKILRRGRGENLWRLDSHNADPIEDAELTRAWRYRGVLPSSALVMPFEEMTAKSKARRKVST